MRSLAFQLIPWSFFKNSYILSEIDDYRFLMNFIRLPWLNLDRFFFYWTIMDQLKFTDWLEQGGIFTGNLGTRFATNCRISSGEILVGFTQYQKLMDQFFWLELISCEKNCFLLTKITPFNKNIFIYCDKITYFLQNLYSSQEKLD